MLADNARLEPLSQAIEQTFDGKHPCALCKSIAKGRQSERKPDTQLEIKKLEFLRESAVIVIASPEHFILCEERAVLHSSLTETPPVPPPRLFFA